MKPKLSAKPLAALSRAAAILAVVAASTAASRATVVVNFGESAPSANIITSYVPASQDAYAWVGIDGVDRVLAESFVTPINSDYSMTSITMKLNQTIPQSFSSPSAFSIDFYQLSNPGQNPGSATFLSTQSGSIQTTTSIAVAGSFFTFNLDAPIALTAGTSYLYVLSFDSVADYNILPLAISSSQPAPNDSIAWVNQNNSGWSNTGETYVYYIQGTAVPEPGTISLVGAAAVAAFLIYRKRRLNPAG